MSKYKDTVNLPDTTGFAIPWEYGEMFRKVMEMSPSEYRARAVPLGAPDCFVAGWTRPSSFGEAKRSASG